MRWLSLLMLAGCVPDLSVLHVWDDGVIDTGDTAEVGPKVVTEAVDEGLETFVDATDGLGWVRVDLDAGGVEVDDVSWDLAFQRFDVSTNSGPSGSADVAVRFYEGLTIGALDAAPTEGWVSDRPDGDDLNDKVDWAFTGWFDYDGTTHIVTVNPGVWAIRTTEGATFALRFDRYYDEAGNSAKIRFTWRELP